ncbi:MAG: branched-chain amino acid transport system substrate-binding protein [Alphaproteobacteria bacterium]|jgi:branched-chain amino acid transport system substrate-binding protein|nr:branched-chain amino acid transport system substrate-binding protein [Alphaproteobacteria bacterium]MEA3027868.1 branched-chain amino acid transport system substrate-binding protein [Alphaproteobacteria bacterium]
MRQLSVIAIVGLAGLGSAFGSLAQPAFGQEPIKIGVMFPLTGPISAQGRPERDAIKQAFEEENNTVAGRKIELLFEDSAGRPDTGLTKIKALVERDKVNLLLSELVSSIGAAVAPYVTEQKIPWVSTVALASLTRAQKSPYIFRFVPSSYQYALTAAEIGKKKGWKKVYFIGWNAPPSRESYEAVKKVFGEENVVEAMFPNVGTSDYAPYLTKVDASKADGMFTAMWGADAPRISQQYAEYGLNKKMPLFGIASFTSEELLGDMPPESAGILSAYTYCGTLDTPENKAFVDGYQSRYKAVPGSYQYMGYMAAKMVIQALKDINGRVEDKDAFIAALGKVQVKGPMGMASFDQNRGMVGDFYVLTVEKGPSGRLQNSCGERIPQVKDPYELFP